MERGEAQRAENPPYNMFATGKTLLESGNPLSFAR
jgi:hypothetical protein